MALKVNTEQQKIDILALNRLKIFNENKVEENISQSWKEGTVVLVFIRHFGCIACRGHVKQIWDKKDSFKKNTKIIFIGNGDPYLIKAFKKDLNLMDAVIYTDPSLEFFAACGLKNSFLHLLDPRGLKEMKKLYDDGHRQSSFIKNTGSHTQMGGVVVLRPPGKVSYHFVSEYIGDFDESQNWEIEN